MQAPELQRSPSVDLTSLRFVMISCFAKLKGQFLAGFTHFYWFSGFGITNAAPDSVIWITGIVLPIKPAISARILASWNSQTPCVMYLNGKKFSLISCLVKHHAHTLMPPSCSHVGIECGIFMSGLCMHFTCQLIFATANIVTPVLPFRIDNMAHHVQ